MRPEPYRKINFLSRKKKDELNLQKLKSEAEQGREYGFIKKSKKPTEVEPGKVAKTRGSVVKSTVVNTPSKINPPHGSFEMRLTAGKTNMKYEPMDVRTGHKEYGPESLTKATPDFIKKAQSERKEIVYKKDLPYRAGEWKKTTTPDKLSSSLSFTKGTVSPGKTVAKIDVTNPSVSSLSKSNSKGPMRKLPRVEWLNKKESQKHITPERRRKKKESGY